MRIADWSAVSLAFCVVGSYAAVWNIFNSFSEEMFDIMRLMHIVLQQIKSLHTACIMDATAWTRCIFHSRSDRDRLGWDGAPHELQYYYSVNCNLRLFQRSPKRAKNRVKLWTACNMHKSVFCIGVQFVEAIEWSGEYIGVVLQTLVNY